MATLFSSHFDQLSTVIIKKSSLKTMHFKSAISKNTLQNCSLKKCISKVLFEKICFKIPPSKNAFQKCYFKKIRFKIASSKNAFKTAISVVQLLRISGHFNLFFFQKKFKREKTNAILNKLKTFNNSTRMV